MGLAPYGEPKYVDVILDKLIDLKPDGSLAMDMRYFNYCQGLTMTAPPFHDLFGGPPRRPETAIEQQYDEVAACDACTRNATNCPGGDNPTQAQVDQCTAACNAAIRRSLSPLVEWSTSTSPERASASTWRAKTCSSSCR